MLRGKMRSLKDKLGTVEKQPEEKVDVPKKVADEPKKVEKKSNKKSKKK